MCTVFSIFTAFIYNLLSRNQCTNSALSTILLQQDSSSFLAERSKRWSFTMFRNKAKKDERAKLVEDARKKRSERSRNESVACVDPFASLVCVRVSVRCVCSFFLSHVLFVACPCASVRAERERQRKQKAARARDAGRQTEAGTVIQRFTRGVLARRHLREQFIQAWEQQLQKLQKVVALMQSMKVTAFQPPAQSVAALLRAFLNAQHAAAKFPSGSSAAAAGAATLAAARSGSALVSGSDDVSSRAQLSDLVLWVLASVKSKSAKCNILSCGKEVVEDLDRLRWVRGACSHELWSSSLTRSHTPRYCNHSLSLFTAIATTQLG